MGGVVSQLLGAAAFGLVDGAAHGIRHRVGVQDRHAVEVARCAADGLDEAAFGAQKAFLVRIQDRHQRHFGNIQSLAQQIDAHQHVEGAQPQVTDDLHALDRIHIRVQIAHAHAVFAQVVGELLGHALGQRGHQHTLVALHAQADLVQQVVHLMRGRPHLHHRVHQAGGAYHLLHHARGSTQFVLARRSRHEDHLPHAPLELLELQRPVV